MVGIAGPVVGTFKLLSSCAEGWVGGMNQAATLAEWKAGCSLEIMSKNQTTDANPNRAAPLIDTEAQREAGDASGMRILVTGANAGIGFWSSLQLAQRGAEVIMACRNTGKAEIAAKAIRARVPDANLRTVELDVSSLDSVANTAKMLNGLSHLDVLIANAGMVHTPRTRRSSVDGLELVAATNYFGHFALVAGLLPALERAGAARVVTLGSLSTRLVRPHLDDPQLLENYSPWRAYAQSKIMVQSFAFELDRRLQLASSSIRALSAHPGYSISGRTPAVAGINEPGILKRTGDTLQAPFTQGKDRGAWPIVRASLDPKVFELPGPVFYGPRGWVKGGPTLSRPASITTNRDAAKTIWFAAESATGNSLLG
jgi:NAD(P)-dependent dehydrogenase (short-subunit alcohol dehydrogenase family)